MENTKGGEGQIVLIPTAICSDCGYCIDNETNFYYLQSRYYNPEIGRFINADNVVAGAGGNAQGYNLFAYCFSNPVNMDDLGGNWPQWIKNSVKWVAKNVIKPVVKKCEETLSKIDLTFSAGLNTSGTPGPWIFNGQIGIAMDTKGNVAIQASTGGGFTGGTPSITLTGYNCITNAPSINALNGPGYQIGGSAIVPIEGVPFAAGLDLNIIPDSEREKNYYGVTPSLGFGLGAPGVETHAEWTTTYTLPKTQFNIYDVARSVYIKIMEW